MKISNLTLTFEWLIDMIDFYAVSAIFQPCSGGLDLWPCDPKIYHLTASTVPCSATFKQRGQKILCRHRLVTDWTTDRCITICPLFQRGLNKWGCPCILHNLLNGQIRPFIDYIFSNINSKMKDNSYILLKKHLSKSCLIP